MQDKSLNIQVVGGLGNQLFSLAAGYVFASENQLDWRVDTTAIPFGSNRTRAYELDQLPLTFSRLNSLSRFQLTYGRFSRNLIRFGIKTSLVRMLENSDSLVGESLDPAIEMKKFHGQSIITGHFIHSNWFELAIKRGFPNKVEIRSPTKHFFKLDAEHNKENISVHVRIGDYLNLPELFPVISESYYLQCIDEIDETRPIIVYTDDRSNLERLFPQLVAKATIIRDQSADITPLETLKLMSQCRHLITGNSTFSTWAGLFAGNHAYSIFTPALHMNGNWFDHLPKNWKRR